MIRPVGSRVTPVQRMRNAEARPVRHQHQQQQPAVLGRRPLARPTRNLLRAPLAQRPQLIQPSQFSLARPTLPQLVGPQRFLAPATHRPAIQTPVVQSAPLQAALQTARNIADAVVQYTQTGPIPAIPRRAQSPLTPRTVHQGSATSTPTVITTPTVALTSSSPLILTTPQVSVAATQATVVTTPTASSPVNVQTATELSHALTAVALQVPQLSIDSPTLTQHAEATQSQIVLVQAKLATKSLAAELILLSTIVKRLPETVQLNRLAAILDRVPELTKTFELKEALQAKALTAHELPRAQVVKVLTQALLGPQADIALRTRVGQLVQQAVSATSLMPAGATPATSASIHENLVDVRARFAQDENSENDATGSWAGSNGSLLMRVQASGSSSNNPNHGGSGEQQNPDESADLFN